MGGRGVAAGPGRPPQGDSHQDRPLGPAAGLQGEACSAPVPEVGDGGEGNHSSVFVARGAGLPRWVALLSGCSQLHQGSCWVGHHLKFNTCIVTLKMKKK